MLSIRKVAGYDAEIHGRTFGIKAAVSACLARDAIHIIGSHDHWVGGNTICYVQDVFFLGICVRSSPAAHIDQTLLSDITVSFCKWLELSMSIPDSRLLESCGI